MESIDGERFIAVFIDDYTRFVATYKMAKKSKVGHFFDSFQQLETNHWNRPFKQIQCDNAAEFLSGKFFKVVESVSMRLLTSEPFEHEHNDTAERFIRILTKKIFVLLFDSKLLIRFWPYALYTANYIYN